MAKAAIQITVIRDDPPRFGKCSSCSAEIEWVTTKGGRAMPLRRHFAPDRVFTTLGGQELLIVDAKWSHFVDCPDAASFRKRR